MIRAAGDVAAVMLATMGVGATLAVARATLVELVEAAEREIEVAIAGWR